MVEIKDDKYYLKKILTDVEFMIEHTKGKSQQEIEANDLLIDSILFRTVGQSVHNATEHDPEYEVRVYLIFNTITQYARSRNVKQYQK